MTSASKAVDGKMVASGRKKIVVPLPRAGPIRRSGVTGRPRAKRCSQRAPSRVEVATSSFDRALTTLAPTPCSPPAVRYVRCSNLPPAWRVVSMTSRAPRPLGAWVSTGMPRPSSVTVTDDPSACRVTPMRAACPFMASSMALSMISQTRWCSPAGPTPPMYMPGRRRTGSRPSRTVMSFAV